MARSKTTTTTDHDEIREWVDSNHGFPAALRGTPNGDDPGVLRIDFPGGEDELQPVSWHEWFEKFDADGACVELSAAHDRLRAGGPLTSDCGKERPRW